MDQEEGNAASAYAEEDTGKCDRRLRSTRLQLLSVEDVMMMIIPVIIIPMIIIAGGPLQRGLLA